MKNFCVIILTLFFLISFNSIFSQKKTSEEIIASIAGLPELNNAILGMYVKNLSADSVIIDYNSKLSLSPASVFKIFPTALALEILGPNSEFKTEIAYSGNIDSSGNLNGDLYVIGHGDPCLGSSNFENHYNKDAVLLLKWVNDIKNAGIKKINGNLIADASFFGKININGKWLWEDVANHYGTKGSSLNYMDNLFFIHFKTGNKEGLPTEIIRINPPDLGIEINNEVITSKNNFDEAYIYFTRDAKKLDIRGTLPMNKSDFQIKGALPDPELYLLNQLENALKISGIAVTGKKEVLFNRNTEANIKVISTTFSPKLSEIARVTNVKSQNLYAEILSYHISKKFERSYADVLKEFLNIRGIDSGGLFVDDACGLSRSNGLTCKQMTDFLIYMKTKSPVSDIFLKTLSLTELKGTVSKYAIQNTEKNKMYAKSGSMTRVRAYAGYIYNNKGEEIAFCVIANNFNCPGFRMRKIFEELFITISNLE